MQNMSTPRLTPTSDPPPPAAPNRSLTGVHGVHDREGHVSYSLEDHLLVGRELPVGGERARDVAGVAVVLAAHV